MTLVLGLLVTGCAPSAPPEAGTEPSARLLIAGPADATGAVASVAAADPEGVFRDLRFVVRSADLALAGPVTGEASEDLTALLAGAGFDAALTLADPRGVQSLSALPGAEPSRFNAGSVPVTLLYTEAGAESPGALLPTPFESPPGEGVTVVLVGGPPEPALLAARRLAARGADLVVVLSGEASATEALGLVTGRPPLVASGLGPLLSAEADPAKRTGWLLEALIDAEGVIAYRLGGTTHADLRAHFAGWELPGGDAALLGGTWWSLVGPIRPVPARRPPGAPAFTYGDLTVAAIGDVTGDGVDDIAASYRHLFRPSLVGDYWPGSVPVDSLGRSAHLGVFDLGWQALWAAGRIPGPIGALAACDGSVALAYTGLDDPHVLATGAAVWDGYGLRPAPELPGEGEPGCADVDGDGILDPIILGRSP